MKESEQETGGKGKKENHKLKANSPTSVVRNKAKMLIGCTKEYRENRENN